MYWFMSKKKALTGPFLYLSAPEAAAFDDALSEPEVPVSEAEVEAADSVPLESFFGAPEPEFCSFLP